MHTGVTLCSRGVIRLMLIVMVVATACGSTQDQPYRTASGLSELPNESLEDWVSYADAVVVARIVSDDGESPLSPDELASGEGMTVRFVTAAVDEIAWARSGAVEREVPRTFSVNAPGWMYSDGKKHPYVMEEGSRLDVGETYLIPIAEYDVEGWQPIGLGVSTDEDGVSELTTDVGERPVGVDPLAAEELSGITIDAAAAKLSATEPDPIAAAHADLDPRGRFRKVYEAKQAARGGPLPPAPGEK